jgi:hypothetical protein
VILKRYGTAFHEVEPNFDARALTEVGFRRARGEGIPSDRFEDDFEKMSGHDLEATAEGWVHDEVERDVLASLEARLAEVHASLGTEEILVIESGPGVDAAKTRAVQRSVVENGDRRLHFAIRVDPPLRVGVYRRRT